ncbi:Asx homology domain-containing protein [Biscogniauxia sp. FL1348]|nr:Asx homology domain-containing protein [Biscogniauxia sp. FL1348]
MPRRKNARKPLATASAVTRPPRRSARSQKNRPTVVNDSSEDELSVQNLTTPQQKISPANQAIQDEIVAFPSHQRETPPLDKTADNTDEHVADAIVVHTSDTNNKTGQNTHSLKGADSDIQASSMDTSVQMSDFRPRPVSDEEDELASNRPAVKKTKVILKQSRSMGSKKGKSRWDDPEEMLTNPNAPLAKAKLRDLLCSSRAWDILTLEEKQQVLAKFPDEQEILDAGTEDARPDFAALRNNNSFRHDVARYQENLAQGRHDPEWIRQALAAHRKRELGLYDEFLARRFIEDWGMKMPDLSQLQAQSQDQAQDQAKADYSSGSRQDHDDNGCSSSKVSGSAIGELESEVTAVKAKYCANGGEEEQEEQEDQGKGAWREETEKSMDQNCHTRTGPADEALGSIQVQLGDPVGDNDGPAASSDSNATTTIAVV